MHNVNHYAALTENDLVALAKSGERAAFSELMRRNYSSSVKLAISILRAREDAEDEVQNAYWKGWRHIIDFQGNAKFSTWMTRIVVNQCLTRLHQGRRAKFVFIDDAPTSEDRFILELPDNRESPENQACSRELVEMLRREIRRIPPVLRNVLMLNDLDELPMDTTAGRLGISVTAAKSRLLRARHELRSRMERHCGAAGSRLSNALKC